MHRLVIHAATWTETTLSSFRWLEYYLFVILFRQPKLTYDVTQMLRQRLVCMNDLVGIYPVA